MFISTNKQLSDAIIELTPYQWVNEEIIKKLTPKEFRLIASIVNKFGTENKIRTILELASKRNIICPECGEVRPDDERVKAGMKCFSCAYN